LYHSKCLFEISKLARKKNKIESEKYLQESINRIEELLETITSKKLEENEVLSKVFLIFTKVEKFAFEYKD
jgi:predicted transcriptional regulator